MASPILSHDTLVISVPCYNEEKHLEATLIALREQSFRDFVVLITDNASTDTTTAIARRYCALDERFHFFRHETNQGSVANFNFAFEATESPFFLWVGAHDLLTADALDFHMNVLRTRPEVSVSLSAHCWIDEEGKRMAVVEDGDLDFGPPNDPERYIRSIGRNENNIAANSPFRRSMLDQERFTVVVGTDRLLASHLAFRGRFANTDRVLYLRRSFAVRTTDNPYMERMAGRANASVVWEDLASAYDARFAELLGANTHAKRWRRRLQLNLRYFLPVRKKSILTMTLWTIRRIRKRLPFIVR